MPRISQLLRQSSVAALALFLSATFSQAQPTAKAQPRPPRPAPAVRATGATLSAIVPQGKPCPETVNFNGTITVNGPTEVKYTFLSSDNSTWPEHTITFTKAGTERVNTTWELSKTYAGWVQLKILSPNTLLSPRANFRVNCMTSRVTRATLVAVVAQHSSCPVNVYFNGAITTNGPAEVKYTWVSFDGGTWPERTLNFAKAGTEKANESRQAPENQTGWMQLKVLSPNAVMSPRANYRVVCPAGKPQK